MSKTLLAALAVATATAAFPANTADTAWTFALKGTLADGTAYEEAVDSNAPSISHDLPAGAIGVVLIVSKNGINSLASDPFDVPAADSGVVTITLTVPDATQKATISIAAAAPVADPAAEAPAVSTDPAPTPVVDAGTAAA
jgi:hypothetical protein